MATLNTYMKMNNPNEAQDFWSNIYELGKTLAPWGTVGWVAHQLINKVFKYFSDSRDAELQALVKKETEAIEKKWMDKFDTLERKLDHVTQMILDKK